MLRHILCCCCIPRARLISWLRLFGDSLVLPEQKTSETWPDCAHLRMMRTVFCWFRMLASPSPSHPSSRPTRFSGRGSKSCDPMPSARAPLSWLRHNRCQAWNFQHQMQISMITKRIPIGQEHQKITWDFRKNVNAKSSKNKTCESYGAGRKGFGGQVG